MKLADFSPTFVVTVSDIIGLIALALVLIAVLFVYALTYRARRAHDKRMAQLKREMDARRNGQS